MRGKSLICGCLAAALCAFTGCFHDRYKLKTTHPEDYVIPPNDPRFDEPPEEDYRKPPEKKKDAPGLNGAPAGGAGGINSNMSGSRTR